MKFRRLRRLAASRRWWIIAAWLLTIVWITSRALGDETWFTGLLSYLPAVVVAVFQGLAAMLTLGLKAGLTRRHRRSLAACSALVALALLGYVARVEMRWRHPVEIAKGQTLRLVHWNVFRNLLAWEPKIERLRRLEADVYVLNELPRQVTRGEWALRFGPSFTYALGDITVIGCRGRVTAQSFQIDDGLATLWADCEIDGAKLRILAVDMPANPFTARDPILARLIVDIETWRPDLVAGDFNTPRRATRLRRLPAGYHHAYDVAGTGWPYTWPVPLPVLAIDQCLVGPRIKALRHRYVSTLSSDHRLQVLDFGLESAPQPADPDQAPRLPDSKPSAKSSDGATSKL